MNIKTLTTNYLTPNMSFTDRELRIVVGSAAIIALLLVAPSPVGLWGLAALLAVPVIVSGIIAWDPIYALIGFNRYDEASGEIHQRNWSASNVGALDRVVRFAVGGALIAFTLASTTIELQAISALIAIPIIMTAILAWDPLYALGNVNTFASKEDVEQTDSELNDSSLVKLYEFPNPKPSTNGDNFGKAA
jgi:hypothetical protein